MSQPRICHGTRTDGEPCTSQLLVADSDFCFAHNPNISDDEKREARSKGGIANSASARVRRSLEQNPDLYNLVRFLGETADGVLDGTYSPAQGSAIASITRSLATLADLASNQHRVDVMERLLERLESGELLPEDDDGE